MRRFLHVVVLCVIACLATSTHGQSTSQRSVDGYGNNLATPSWGAAASMMLNTCTPSFSDGLSTPAGLTRPNPRAISNAVFAQAEERFSPQDLNDFWWAFGQFVDHDITLTGNNAAEPMDIEVPQGDPMFDPLGQGDAQIGMLRSVSTTDATGMRRYLNEITAFVDASNVYGSDVDRYVYLRSYEGGKLRTSAGDYPPFNTLTGEYGAPVDPQAPHMEGMRSPDQRMFVCGDVRANENSLLLALHTVWLREHNRLCDSLVIAFPGAADEALFQHARRLVEGSMQHILYEEWLPAIGLDMQAVVGYDATTDPSIANEFAAAAFRFGHTLVGRELWSLDAVGGHEPTSPLAVRDLFFNPVGLLQQEGLTSLMRGASAHPQQALDCQVVDELRSFLFGAPGAGGLDLVALNINRGRDRGVASYQTLRFDLGLSAKPDFTDLTADLELANTLERLYGSMDELDPWVGMLAESAVSGTVGETLEALLREQFGRLRQGDRFFYDVHPENTALDRAFCARQTLKAVLARNTSGFSYGSASSFHVQPRLVSTAEVDGALASVRVRHQNGKLHVSGLPRGDASWDLAVYALDGRVLSTWRDQASYAGSLSTAIDQPLPRMLVVSVEGASGLVSRRVPVLALP